VSAGQAPELVRAASPDLARLEASAALAESLGLGFHLGAAVERIAWAAGQGSEGVRALREASWLIERYAALVEQRPIGADIHASGGRLARAGEAIDALKTLAASLESEIPPARSVAAPPPGYST
jgi:hypothetical protein